MSSLNTKFGRMDKKSFNTFVDKAEKEFDNFRLRKEMGEMENKMKEMENEIDKWRALYTKNKKYTEDLMGEVNKVCDVTPKVESILRFVRSWKKETGASQSSGQCMEHPSDTPKDMSSFTKLIKTMSRTTESRKRLIEEQKIYIKTLEKALEAYSIKKGDEEKEKEDTKGEQDDGVEHEENNISSFTNPLISVPPESIGEMERMERVRKFYWVKRGPMEWVHRTNI